MTEFFAHLMHEFEIPLKNPVLVFALILFIILLAPILLRRLNIPGIIGLIIAGVIIGPHGFNVLERNSAINLFSTIGLLYIMFIAGIELDMNEFKSNRNKSVVFGIYTFIIPLALGFPVVYYLLGYDFNASLLTASMFATHTIVSYPIASKFGVAKNQAVAITVGGTILTDTAVLIILAVIIGNSQGTLDQAFWFRLIISMILFSLIMFLVIPRIAKWFFRKMESEKQEHYIFVLSMVFLAAFLAELAGVEPIIGAFAAGLALNKLIPHSSTLMNRIAFIGNSLFIPFFLISVGMVVDLSVIAQGPMALIIAGTLSLVAIAGKWLAAFFTQITFKYSKAQRQLIFGLSSSHAAATLAVILVGYKAGVLDDNILNGTIILILITCLISSFATELSAKKLIQESERDTETLFKTSGANNEQILMPVMNIGNIEKLLELSFLIRDKKSIHPISILTVVSNNDEAEINILKAKSKLDELIKEASAAEVKVKSLTTIDVNVANGIARISREIMADIIVMGWPQRRGLIEKLIGENMDNVVDKTDKTTFICYLDKPLVLHKRIKVAVPPLGEHENGFNHWVMKIALLAQELSIPIQFLCNERTDSYIRKVFAAAKLTASFTFTHFSDWDDFMIVSREVNPDDLFVLVSARKGSTSYRSILEGLPFKMEKYLATNSRIIIYPQQFSHNYILDGYEDVSAEPLNKGYETIQRIGRGIGNIFKKEAKK